MGSQKKRNKKIKYTNGSGSGNLVPHGFEELLDLQERKLLRQLPSYAGYKEDYGKEIYSWSDSRTWIDLSPGQKHKSLLSFGKLFLIVLSTVLILWFITSFVYRMVTETDQGKVALSMLPSFIIVAACAAILFISVFGGWGGFLRWGYKHNLVHGRDAAEKRFHREMKEEIERARLAKYNEYAVDVTEEYVILTMSGQKYPFFRNAVTLNISKKYDLLHLDFVVDGKQVEFIKGLPKEQFVYLRKAFEGKSMVIKPEEKSKFDAKKLVKEIPFLIVAVGIVAVSVLGIVAHYLWIPELPPVIGVFFLLMSGLVFCNIFSDIPAVSELGVPFAFSVVLLVFPPMAYIWVETELMGNEITFLHVLTHCTPFAAGFGFFFVMGFYTLTFAISKAVDYIRFGK